jgi:hypothetical protein
MASAIHHLTAVDLVVGAPTARKRRRLSLVSALKAARKAGANHVEVIGEKIVIPLTGEAAERGCGEANEWDDVLPRGDIGTR